jgi:hypothetical protein
MIGGMDLTGQLSAAFESAKLCLLRSFKVCEMSGQDRLVHLHWKFLPKPICGSRL